MLVVVVEGRIDGAETVVVALVVVAALGRTGSTAVVFVGAVVLLFPVGISFSSCGFVGQIGL